MNAQDRLGESPSPSSHRDPVVTAALDLLARRSSPHASAVHLDVGATNPEIGARLASIPGRHYVALIGRDIDAAAFEARGLEVHRLPNEDDMAATVAALDEAAGRRPIASLSLLDAATADDGLLGAVAGVARRADAVVVVAAFNAARADIGFRLAFGHAPVKPSDDGRAIASVDDVGMAERLAGAGLVAIDTADVRRAIEDLAVASDHPALAKGTLLHTLLIETRRRIDDHADTVAFVRLCVAAPAVREQVTSRPFLSAVVRTQGKRLHTLTETLLAMTAQSDDDFEIVLIGHRVPDELRPGIVQTVEDLPEWVRDKVRTFWVETGTRTRPLNVGFAEARGRYISILDDDDIPMAHWVETFRKLDSGQPGRVLRAGVVRQDVENVVVADRHGLRAEGTLERTYPNDFDLIAHLAENYTPPVSLAFPRGAFHDLAIHFDETLTTVEDWDFLMRTIAVTGIACSPEITSVYRWWPRNESSRTAHPPEEWRRNHKLVADKLDDLIFLLPKGTASILASGGVMTSTSGSQEGKIDPLAAAMADIARYRGKRRSLAKRVVTTLRQRIRQAYWRLRYAKKLRKVSSSCFFNPHWYAYIYPDVARSGLDPLVHYVTRGAREGRDPGPYFSASAYRTANPELVARSLDALIHYIDHGAREGRTVRPSRLTHPV